MMTIVSSKPAGRKTGVDASKGEKKRRPRMNNENKMFTHKNHFILVLMAMARISASRKSKAAQCFFIVTRFLQPTSRTNPQHFINSNNLPAPVYWNLEGNAQFLS
ncbi:hypothetical protein [Enterobacter huaxiensis]|uniref:hypothetical protein n=1 Tax=Enterobacter huaxiensis TaxID=2494702 RepID=UPI0021D7E0A4|nr:hypothetical protein [Enterobacter huaxiensis]